MNKIKIAYLVSTLKPCGPTSQLYNLIKYLDRSEFEASVITLSPESSESRWNEFVNLDISVQSLNLSRFKGMLLASSRLRSLVKRNAFEIIHTSGIRADSAAIKFTGCKVVSTLRNYPFDDYSTEFGKFKGSLVARYHIGLLKMADLPVTVSNAVRTRLKSVCDVDFRVVENGVDRQIFRPAVNDSEKRFLREKSEIPLDTCIFLTAGAMTDLKNPKMLIEAFKTGSLRKEFYMIFLGDGPQMQECRMMAGTSENIIFKGYVNSTIDLIKAADFYISASKSEGMPNAVLEALSCGMPCLLSNIEPHKEIINKNANAGMLFDLDSVLSLTETVKDIRSGDYKAMSSSACELADVFHAKKTSQKYQDLYRSLLGR